MVASNSFSYRLLLAGCQSCPLGQWTSSVGPDWAADWFCGNLRFLPWHLKRGKDLPCLPVLMFSDLLMWMRGLCDLPPWSAEQQLLGFVSGRCCYTASLSLGCCVPKYRFKHPDATICVVLGFPSTACIFVVATSGVTAALWKGRRSYLAAQNS